MPVWRFRYTLHWSKQSVDVVCSTIPPSTPLRHDTRSRQWGRNAKTRRLVSTHVGARINFLDVHFCDASIYQHRAVMSSRVLRKAQRDEQEQLERLQQQEEEEESEEECVPVPGERCRFCRNARV